MKNQSIRSDSVKKGKIKDFLLATKDEAVDVTVESGGISEIIKSIGETVVSEGPAMIIGEIAGAIAPRINGIRLSYKQNRFESHVKQALEIFSKRIETLELNYENLDKEIQEKFSTEYLAWLLDNLYEEKQKEKIKYHVNGYINLMSNEANDNLVLMFFDTMNELTRLDIEVLNLYSLNTQDNIWELCKRYNLETEQIIVIKEKLARLGLLQSKNDEQRDKNLDYVIQYLEVQDKDNRKKKPSGVSFPKTRIKKINRFESYSITKLGRGYLQVISES